MKPFRFLIYLLATCNLAYGQLEKRQSQDGSFGFWEGEKWVVPPRFDEAGEFHQYPFAPVQMKGKWGLIDRQGNLRIACTFDAESNDSDGSAYWIVQRGGKYGMISLRTGSVLIDPKYDSFFSFDNPLTPAYAMTSVVTREGRDGMVDSAGVEFIPCIYDHPSIYEFDSLRLQAKLKGKRGVVNRQGQVVVPFEYDLITSDVGPDGKVYITVKKGKSYGLYSDNGQVVAQPIYQNLLSMEAGGFALARIGKEWGVIDRTGRLVVPVVYDAIDYDPTADPDAIAFIVSKGKKKGLYNREGAVLATVDFDAVGYFESDGLAVISKQGMSGLIDRKGTLVVPCVHANETTLMAERQKLGRK